jgi:DnaJ-class molecular chaperone
MQEARSKAIAARKCPVCFRNDKPDGRYYCAECQTSRNDRNEETRLGRDERAECTRCGKPGMTTHKQCDKCRAKRRNQQRRSNANL